MRILVLGGDGYLGWPTAMYLLARGHDVGVVDNFAKRRWEVELNVEPLIPIRTLHDRVKAWREVTGRTIELFVGDLRNYGLAESALKSFRPEAIIHYGEQPSAPYSMIDHNRAIFTQTNNIIRQYGHRVKKDIILPRVRWDGLAEAADDGKLAWAAPRASED